MKTPSLRRRLALVVIGVLAATVFALDVFVYTTVQSRLESDLLARMRERAIVGAAIYGGQRDPIYADGGPLTVSSADIANTVSGNDIAVAVFDGVLYYSGFPITAEGLKELAPYPSVYSKKELQKAIKELPDARTYETIIATRPAIVVARANAVDQAMSRLLLAEIVGTIVVLILAAAIVWRLVGVTLRPLDSIAGIARRIAAGDLEPRVKPSDPDTELGVVGTALDEMLDSLGDALAATRRSEERMREFLADASHELRTPLAGLRANLEVLLRAEHNKEEREVLLLKVGREATRASQLVENLLDISRIDQGLQLERRAVDLHELAEQELERAADLAPELTFELDGEGPCVVEVDESRIRQVLANLLDNARSISPPGAAISVSIGIENGTALVEVSDEGPGVPAIQRERIFERFVRLDGSRARDCFGSGLGLSIARGIAKAHGGDVRCLDSSHGARFQLTLPRR